MSKIWQPVGPSLYVKKQTVTEYEVPTVVGTVGTVAGTVACHAPDVQPPCRSCYLLADAVMPDTTVLAVAVVQHW